MIAALSVVLLVGCVHAPDAPAPAEMITYRTDAGFCFGPCEWADLSVSSDGLAVLRLHRRSGYHYRQEDIRTRRVRITREQFVSFRAALSSIRPTGELAMDTLPPCVRLVADGQSFDVRWHGDGQDSHLSFDTGCDTVESGRIWKALATAPSLLGLKGVPGTNLPSRLEH
jgi:hypothetical protein